MLFLTVTRSSIAGLKSVLDQYCLASGQTISLNKSSITFSPNTSPRLRNVYAATIGIQAIQAPSKYLGVPILFGRGKKQCFQDLIDKTSHRLAAWKGRLLSPSGREVLIKVVVAAIPAFFMSHFSLPVDIINKLHALMACFYWGESEGERRVHWVSWETLCLPKRDGGLGFKDLATQNVALLAKLGWQLLSNPKSLWASLMKSVYYPFGRFLEAGLGNSPSWAWRGILKGRELLQQGILWRVGSGERIRIWEDAWLPNFQSSHVQTPRPTNCMENYVYSLIDHVHHCWDVQKVRNLFSTAEVNCILQIPLSTEGFSDVLTWGPTPNGKFSISSAYRLAKQTMTATTSTARLALSIPKKVWKIIWSSELPPRICTFIWKACLNAIGVGANLKRRNIMQSDQCPCCGDMNETVAHALMLCGQAQNCWFASPVSSRTAVNGALAFYEWVLLWYENFGTTKIEKKDSFLLHGLICWEVWKLRNQRSFGVTVEPLSMWLQKVQASICLHTEKKKFQLANNYIGQQYTGTPLVSQDPQLVKIFTDAACPTKTMAMGLGAVFIDQHSNVIGMCSENVFHADAIVGEALAVRRGLVQAKSCGFHGVVIHSDCQVLVCCLTGDIKTPPAAIAAIISDIVKLGASMGSVSFVHVSRLGNKCAHALASWALSYPGLGYWTPPFPDELLHIVNMLSPSLEDE